MQKVLRIGTRESQLAVWQATLVQDLLKREGVASELVYIRSEGDIDTVTPLYALGVTGVFTKALDTALLNNRIDIAVHSMKDVPVQVAQGIQQAAVLERASHKDILVLHPHLKNRNSKFSAEYVHITEGGSKRIDNSFSIPVDADPTNPDKAGKMIIATSSIRRIAQWLNTYPNTQIENLRGNVNTRLRKLEESNWHGAIFAAAGLERIDLRPQHSIDLDWMLPAPAQGAIMVVCREDDAFAFDACQSFNHSNTALATKIERDFLSALMGGCSTPISALAEVKNKYVHFKGNIVSTDGKQKQDVAMTVAIEDAAHLGTTAAKQLLENGGQAIVDSIRKRGLTDEA